MSELKRKLKVIFKIGEDEIERTLAVGWSKDLITELKMFHGDVPSEGWINIMNDLILEEFNKTNLIQSVLKEFYDKSTFTEEEKARRLSELLKQGKQNELE